MGLFWVFAFTIFLLYLSNILVTNVETMDGWLKATYFLVLTAGYATVIYMAREHYKNKYESIQRKFYGN